MWNRATCGWVCGLVFLALGVQAVERQVVPGHVRAAVARLAPAGRVAGTNRLQLAIGLPLHHRDALTNVLRAIYDPSSASFRHYLTPEQFTETFGATEAEYQAVIGFAKAHGLAVTGTHANRMLVDVEGAAADIEGAFGIKLNLYAHPQEARNFFAPDTEPSVDAGLAVLHISGLDNYVLPKPRLHVSAAGRGSGSVPRSGSAPGGGGGYFGTDFRNAYIPQLAALTGSGQTVGLFEFDGFYTADISRYEALAGLRGVPVKTNLIDGFNGVPGGGNEEVALDIEMVVSMASGLKQLLVYEASPFSTTANMNDMINKMATDNSAKAISCGWGFDLDTVSQQIFQQFAAQGQSFLVASGDNGAYGTYVDEPGDDPYVTSVGGTELITDTSHNYLTEAVWSGSGGGISSVYPLPTWQRGVSTVQNGGSPTMRNIPDVAAVGDNVYLIADDLATQTNVEGTSCSTPLWTAFIALVNQQAAASGKPPVGFLNPALYAIGQGASYAQCFHDITTGDNESAVNPNLFFATVGYDLCTGWGSVNGGTNLVDALLAPATEPLLITPPLGFYSQGAAGGPFSQTSQTYTLTNIGASALNWSVANTSAWLHVSPSSGTLTPGGGATPVSVTLNSAASNLLIITYTGNVVFSNLTDGAAQDRQFTLLAGNGGFETGDFTGWQYTGADFTSNNIVDSVDATDLYGGPFVPGVNDSLFVHSGIYGACLGQYDTLGSLSQTVPTTAGQLYLLSFWVDNPTNYAGFQLEFFAFWNGALVYGNADNLVLPWTNIQAVVTATTASTVLEFQFFNIVGAWGLDDVSVQPAPAPVVQKATRPSPGTISFTWSTIPGGTYQVQYTDSLGASTWNNLHGSMVATGSTLSTSDSFTSSPQRFYRVVLQ